MKKALAIILLFCTTLLCAQSKRLDVWQEIDTLIVQGHYTTAYEKSEQLLRKAKREKDSHNILKAVYKQRIAAASYQEDHVEKSIEAYRGILPMLKEADKSIAYLFLGSLTDSKRTYYEAALAESEALKIVRTEDYDLLIEGDTMGLRLRPTLYDVVIHSIIDNLYLGDNKERAALFDQRQLLMGTADEFVNLTIPNDTALYTLWQLKQLQALTRHHQSTTDMAVRAHIDFRRMERMQSLTRDPDFGKEYVNGLERIVDSYERNPTEQAMILYLLAKYYTPQIYTYTENDKAKREVEKARKMEVYIRRISEIAPNSEWDIIAKALYKSVTNSYLSLQKHSTILPGQAHNITLTVRNAGKVLYRIVPRYVGEHNDNFVFKEVIGRKSVGKAYYQAEVDLPDAYTYKNIPLVLPPLDAGDYFVIATNNGKDPDTKRSSITSISVTNLKMSMIANGAEKEHIGMVLDATTGKAITDCEVNLMEESGQKTRLIERIFPDEKGYFTVPFPSGSNRNLYLRASDGHSHTTYEFQYSDFAENRYWTNNEEDASTLFTFLPDRYTYEPGDTVRFGIVAYSHGEMSSHVKSHLPIGLTLTDARRKEIGTLQGITDEWGCYNGSFALPKEATPGRFKIQVTDSISERTMYHTINVEAFKAPTFTAKIERPTTIVRFGDSLTIQGTATTYTGLPVTGAKVKYNVIVNNEGIFGYQSWDATSACDTSATTSTDEKGNFYIPLKVGKSTVFNDNSTCRYTIKADITDISGETQSTQTSFIVGQRTKHASLSKRKDVMMHGDSISYSLLTLNGQRISEDVILKLSKLKVAKQSGIRDSEESDWEQWDEEYLLIERDERTNADTDNYIAITDDMPCGTYRLTITYTDEDKQYNEVAHFELWSEGKGTVSSHILYSTATRAHDVATGDTAMIYVGTRHSNVYTHYYIKVEDKVVKKGTLCLTNETTAMRIPIEEGWRNMMFVYFVSVKDNIKRTSREFFFIEDKASLLNLHLSTLRNPLEPGDAEQCTISVSDYWGKPVQTALTLSVYDAALDAYGKNYWDIALAPQKGGGGVRISENTQYAWENNIYVRVPHPTQPKYYALPHNLSSEGIFYNLPAPATTRGLAKNRAGFDTTTSEVLILEDKGSTETSEKTTAEKEEATELHLRQNLRHTALFLPTLHTNEQGTATFTLTAPDLLTRWHIKGLAHTKDLKHGRMSVDFITRKELMIEPNVPRFLYEGDVCNFTAKITNSSNKPTEVTVKLDATSQSIPEQTLTMEAGSSTFVSFAINVPEGMTSMTYHITARSNTHSDGEKGVFVIFPRRFLVTETMSLYLNGKEKREFTFEALKNNHSETLEHHSLKLNVVSNPMWYVIEALPPLSKENNPSNEQLFHRYYAASLGSKLIEEYPEVEGYSDFYQRDSLIALQQALLNRLSEAQHSDGGWAWMEGFSSDLYTTQLIVKGIGELESMGCIAIAQNEILYTMLKQGIGYLDRIYQDRFDRMERKPQMLDGDAQNYLYVRTMFPELPLEEKSHSAYKHYQTLLLKDKTTRGTLMQKAQKMLTLVRMGESNKALKIAKVVMESSLENDEMGIYWRDNRYGYNWGDNPITTQALLIEAFVQLSQPSDIIARMQQWLLKQKQTTHWGNTIATAQAIHALLGESSGRNALSETSNVKIKIDRQTLNDTQDTRLGTIQKEWETKDIHSSLAKVSLEKQTETPTWGTMTWQYYEEIDKVKASGTGLTLTTTYYKIESTEKGETLVRIVGNTSLEKGDRIRVCMQFTADRAMDYVELCMHRPAALEAVSTRSGYTYNKGLAYYRSIENTQNKYYLQRIEKGKYTIECDFWVAQTGTYSCGVSTIQCMYAPAFMATTDAMRLKI